MLLLLFLCHSICESGNGDVTYSVVAETLIISGTGAVTKNGVRSQGDYTEFITAIIEEGIVSIDSEAFSECRKLKTISIPSSVTNIEKNSFYRCQSLSTNE